jgi:short-subunit dehydrogenase
MRQVLDGTTVVVITGASSGIGRETALTFARHGVRLVLAARSAEGLEDVVEECIERGALTEAVEADTGRAEDVRRLAQHALDAFGRIDVWVNNAGVAAFGRFTDTPIDAHDEVIRTNLMGYIHGAHAAMEVFFQQDAGVLINVVSMAGWAPTPLAASYSASKFGNRGFSEALRIELSGHDRIKICDVYPAFVDTPMLDHVANYSDRFLKPVPPVVKVEAVARKIVSLAERPKAFNPVGIAFPMAVALHSLSPRLFRWTAARVVAMYEGAAAPRSRTDGALFEPSTGGPTRGGLRSPGLRIVAVSGAIAVMAGLRWMMRRPRR